MKRLTLRRTALVIGAAALAIGATSGVRTALESSRDAASARIAPAVAWDAALSRLTSAIDREDRSSVLYEWRAAYAVGIASRSWEPMVTLGDVAQRIAALDRQREPFEREARAAYLLALRAARRSRSNEGLMAAAAGFGRLGDAEMAARVRRLAGLHADASIP